MNNAYTVGQKVEGLILIKILIKKTSKELIRFIDFLFPQLNSFYNIFFENIRKMKSSQQRIFLEQDQNVGQIQSQIYVLDDNNNEMEYLSQFINSSGSDNLQSNSICKQQKQVQQLKRQNQIISERGLQNQQKMKNSQKQKKRQKSFFHNFQKHLVITLRNIIKLKKNNIKSLVQEIANQMWIIFQKSGLYSKKFLYVLFGVYTEKDESQFSKQFLNQLGYMQIFAKYTEAQIKQAQKYLRRQTVKQFQSMNLKAYLLYRKLKRVQQFKKYIQEFLEQIKEGSIRKRLPKQKKIHMMQLPRQKLTQSQVIG